MFRSRSRQLKAQSSVEFMLIFIFFIAVLTIAIMVTSQQIGVAFESQLRVESEKIINNVASKINIAQLEGPGFSINLTLPQKILSYNYYASIYSNRILLNVDNEMYQELILTQNLTGELKLTHGHYLVENINGGINISLIS